MKTNVKKDSRFSEEKLAGGSGLKAAKQDAASQLRRAVMSCLLWENLAYESGSEVAQNITSLIPQVDPEVCAQIAIEARYDQKLRHVPLLICKVMAGLKTHKALVGDTLYRVINRPDEITEFLSIYWVGGKCPISKQVKLGLAKAFSKFDEYQLAKWDRGQIKLKDVMRMVHPRPNQDNLYKKVVDGTLSTPTTWEVKISEAGSDVNKKRAAWELLLDENKLGALALLKNLRGMQQCNVPNSKIVEALNRANPQMLLPIDFIRAADNAPSLVRPIEDLMFRCLSQFKKLAGETLFILDVSGSMGSKLSSKTEYTRIDAGIAMAILAMEMAENCSIYLTAGKDYSREHKTELIPSYRGFGLASHIKGKINSMGGGGIFTRQCLESINKGNKPDRIIVFSDSQDCDLVNKVPNPFGVHNYIVDVSSHKNGINYKGVWTAEISGWSEHFLRFISELETQ
ncbi:MAG: VWA domain-containing protein [Rickettsiaceae bacterium]|nr:VWA domain-containing protein [Rickettsiaceae bacterium]